MCERACMCLEGVGGPVARLEADGLVVERLRPLAVAVHRLRERKGGRGTEGGGGGREARRQGGTEREEPSIRPLVTLGKF